MLIGVRFLLLFVVVAVATTSLAYLFTRKPRFLLMTKIILKVAVLVLVLLGLHYFLMRI